MKNQYTYQDCKKERKTLNMKNWDWVHFVSYAMLDMSCYCVFLNRRAFVLLGEERSKTDNICNQALKK